MQETIQILADAFNLFGVFMMVVFASLAPYAGLRWEAGLPHKPATIISIVAFVLGIVSLFLAEYGNHV